jgi:ABC-type polysaccharide/polyol phosphate transport system ATPase subunit
MGEIRVDGKLTPLLNLAPGIEMEDTGYDNIITCGLLLGMSLPEVTAKAPEVVAFSELGDYIHLPVRTYSSGMLARLSAAIATSLEPHILLMDEGIGAADIRFGEKLSRKVKSLVEKTEILVLASHSEPMIDSMCDKAALLHHGRLLEFGSVESVKAAYHKVLQTG